MNVSDFMQKNPITIGEDKPIRNALRIIFNLGVSAVLVVKEKRLTGIVTEEDILQRLFPSMRDFMEDYLHARSFELLEEKLEEIIDKPVGFIMTKPVKSVTKDTPLMRALSMMLVNNFSHVPVVKEGRELVGIISQGDIFKAIVSSEIPYDSEQEYHDWISYHFDFVSKGSNDRYTAEVKSLDELFRKTNVSRILDIGCGTGSHILGLAEKGYSAVGVEKSKKMYKTAEKKRMNSSVSVQEHSQFIYGNSYEELLNGKKGKFTSAIFMGNMLAHIPNEWRQVLKIAAASLVEKNAVLFLQLAGFKRVMNRNGLRNFTIGQSQLSEHQKYAFAEFYSPPENPGDHYTLTMAVLHYNGKRWASASINSTPVAYIDEEIITPILNRVGFNKISFFGSKYGEPLLVQQFNPEEHDWLNVVAQR